MSDGMSSSARCPPSAEDLTPRVEGSRGSRRMGAMKKWNRRKEKDLSEEEALREELKLRRMQSSFRVEEAEERMRRSLRVAERGTETQTEMKRAERGTEMKRAERGTEIETEIKRAERARWIDELMSKSLLKNNSERVPMAVGKDKEQIGPLLHPFHLLDLDRLGLGDEDPHGESMKLEEEVMMKGKDENHHAESPKLEAQTEGKERRVCFVDLDGVVWDSEESEEDEEPKPKSPPRRMEMEDKVDVWRMMEPEEQELEEMEPDDEQHWMTVRSYRILWDKQWSGYYGVYGSFEDTTRISPMRFTDKDKALKLVYVQRNTLQVYSVKLAATRGSLQLPIDVFGMIAVRDPIDHNRNIIFQRKRDECHTLTEKDPYFVLEGPTRAVMFSDMLSDPMVIEVDLKVKGATESEDEYLSFLVSPLTCSGILSRVFKCGYTSKLSRLEFTLGHIVFSVEATIFVRITDGSWPSGLRGLFSVTTVFSDVIISPGVVHERIILLDSRCQQVPVDGDGNIKLSRNVISTECIGEVIFQAKALEDDIKVVEKDVTVGVLEENKSINELDIGFCKIEVTVVWSRVSQNP